MYCVFVCELSRLKHTMAQALWAQVATHVSEPSRGCRWETDLNYLGGLQVLTQHANCKSFLVLLHLQLVRCGYSLCVNFIFIDVHMYTALQP